MLIKEKIDRINTLARKSKIEPLTPEEKKEQSELREEYLKSFRECFKRQLESIRIVDDSDDVSCVEKNKEKN
ncbi:MAG: DUF896 domain-containing protein [Anaerovoracaceae bacterium]|jgi:uncharacterized protein YnzC (UPF0291/DUF896 family)